MRQDVSELSRLEQQVSSAYVQLGAARTAFDRSPNIENRMWVNDAEVYVNRLLDQLPRTGD